MITETDVFIVDSWMGQSVPSRFVDPFALKRVNTCTVETLPSAFAPYNQVSVDCRRVGGHTYLSRFEKELPGEGFDADEVVKRCEEDSSFRLNYQRWRW